MPGTFYKGEVELLLIDAIKHKPYEDLTKLKEDLLTYLKFKFPIEEFIETSAIDFEYWYSSSSENEFFKDYLVDILVDFWDIFKWDMFPQDMNLTQFTKDEKYLKEKDLLKRYSWQEDMKIEDVVKENIHDEM